jgi:hypothetical protein
MKNNKSAAFLFIKKKVSRIVAIPGATKRLNKLSEGMKYNKFTTPQIPVAISVPTRPIKKTALPLVSARAKVRNAPAISNNIKLYK